MIKTTINGKICVILKSTLDQFQPCGLLKLKLKKYDFIFEVSNFIKTIRNIYYKMLFIREISSFKNFKNTQKFRRSAEREKIEIRKIVFINSFLL